MGQTSSSLPIKRNKNTTSCEAMGSDRGNDPVGRQSSAKVFFAVTDAKRTTESSAPRNQTSCPGANNLPPLLFHSVHGENIRISRDGATARRHESFCKGVTFSARPVRVNERVYVKFSEISNNWSGVIRFGFTFNDPSTQRHGLPKYACPDLTNKPGYWAKALAERFCEKDNILFYYVNSAGDVHFGINGEEKGIFFSGVETRGPLWTLIDVYGNCTAIEFLDARVQMNNASRRHSTIQPDVEVDRVLPALQSLQVHEEMPAPRFTSVTNMSPVPFHRTRGRNVRLSADRIIASRADTEFCQGYVFTARPLRIGERLIVQILSTEPMYVGALALGLTSCDPATLQTTDLPDDSDMLLDRPEYWVVSKDIANTPQRGDELSFCVNHKGEVQISKNNGPPSIVMHVDQSLQLWAFLDVYGSTQSIRVMSVPPPQSPQRLRVLLPTGSESMNSLNSQAEQRRNMVVTPAPSARLISVPAGNDMVQLQPSANGGTLLVVNLPPSHAGIIGANSNPNQTNNHHNSTNTIMSNYSNTYVEPVSQATYSRLDGALGGTGTSGPFAGEECTICYEHPIDCVLYMCGHMCMCYECAVQQWRGKGGGHCPLCRAVIRDVIRTYKSC